MTPRVRCNLAWAYLIAGPIPGWETASVPTERFVARFHKTGPDAPPVTSPESRESSDA